MKVKVFYGWFIVAAALALTTYNHGAITYGFTAFIAPIASTFGWSYAQISLATSLRGLEVGALDPFVGVAVDRWPARRLMLIGVILYGLGLVFISQATSLTTFFLGFLVLGLGISLVTSVVPQATIARWFRKDLGKASAVRALSGGIGGALVPVMVRIIDTYSWQTTLLILAGGIWVIGIPLSFVFRTRPEEYGLAPDGIIRDKPDEPDRIQGHSYGAGVKQAIKMRAFWHIGLTYMLEVGPVFAVVTHVMPYLASLGIERSTASMVAMAIPLVSLVMRMPYGWLADMFTKKYVLGISASLVSAGLFLFWLIDGKSAGLIIVFAIVMGLGIAGITPVMTPIIREHFGTRNFGTIFGMISVFNMVGLLTYPTLAGLVYDTIGSYKPVWLVFGAGAAVAAVVISTAPHPEKESQ